MYMKDIVGNTVSDDVEFDDLEEFDYVEEFAKETEEEDYENYEDYEDDLDDLYIDDEEDDFIEDDEEFEDFESFEEDGDLFDDEVEEEVELKFICEDCGHKWVDTVSETDEENDSLDVSCPICGSRNVTTES